MVLQVAVPFLAEDFLQAVVEQYEAQNPDVRVQLVPTQGFGMPVASSDDPEEYLDNLAAYFSSADVLLIDSELNSEVTRAGYILDLSPLTQSDSTFDAAAFHPALLRSFQWDGGRWALPISASFTVVSYIPEAFDAAGLAYPSASWTLADLERAARTLTQYNADGTIAVPGLVTQGGANTLSTLFLSLLGQGVIGEATLPSDPDFTNPLLETYLNDWLQMVEDGLLQTPAGVSMADVALVIGGGQFFGAGVAGFDPGGQAAAQQQDAPERATALLPGGRAGLNVNGYAVSSGTRHPQAAYDLVMFLVNHPNAVAASLGTVPAVRDIDSVDVSAPGIGGFLTNILSVPAELEPLVDDALRFGIPLAERRFSDGITTALNLMQNEGYDARAALDEAHNRIITRLAAADERAVTRQIIVAEPRAPVQLVAGEIMLDFAVLGAGGGGGAQFTQQNQWQAAVDAFMTADPQVAAINIETATQIQLSGVTADFDCFYVNGNLLPDTNLDHLLSLDPLLDIDPSFDASDFVGGVFDQVRVNNQTWALPVQISPLVLRFNHDMFRMAGITPPQGSWTVSEFEDAIRQFAFVLGDDQTSVALNASGQSALLALIAAYGGLPFDTRSDPPSLNFTDPVTVDAIRQVLDLASAGYLSVPASGGGLGGGFGGAGQRQTPIPIYSNVMNAFGFAGLGGMLGGGGGVTSNTDGMMTFPRGSQFNVVPVNLGTAYISASTQHAEACYRFITHLTETTDLFQSMPVRRSVINNPQLTAARGEQAVAFFNALADLMESPATIVMPTNLNTSYFGMTNWLFDVFTAYVDGEVVDVEADLRRAEQTTRDYLACLDAIPAFDTSQGNFQAFFQQINQCQVAVSTD
jgi:ABC-type glycerol-3-phosphate transport system substrate-binding protein